ncbi:VOC family protein [Octadecabacter sp. G9-8]|uniref:VOC family protein n=1 Tax=Octadecabacter dasysiphoniae TaxID=2909341 RepID=A0ABS9CV34_9RHOB|nr:VOC family protein [Octadecabacter dasysiphoniae]MCF2870791.1 VOC family protein [Octadecabacter dasysiphoniae]
MTVVPYLKFNGTCRTAMTTYAKIFGVEIEMMMTAAEMPDFDAPDGTQDHIAHCSMKVASGEIYASDSFMDGSGAMDGCSIMVSLPSNVASRAAFNALADGGAVEMPFQPTFWSGGFGTCTDKFGVKWMISSLEEPAQG